MKEVTIKMMVYEVGDIVDVSKAMLGVSNKHNNQTCNYGIIIDVNQRINNKVSYWVLTDRKTKEKICDDDIDKLKYHDHMDVSKFEKLCK